MESTLPGNLAAPSTEAGTEGDPAATGAIPDETPDSERIPDGFKAENLPDPLKTLHFEMPQSQLEHDLGVVCDSFAQLVSGRGSMQANAASLQASAQLAAQVLRELGDAIETSHDSQAALRQSMPALLQVVTHLQALFARIDAFEQGLAQITSTVNALDHAVDKTLASNIKIVRSLKAFFTRIIDSEDADGPVVSLRPESYPVPDLGLLLREQGSAGSGAAAVPDSSAPA